MRVSPAPFSLPGFIQQREADPVGQFCCSQPHLISVMSVVMRFTPAEQRRLVAKAGGK